MSCVNSAMGETMAMLLLLFPKDIEPREHLPAPIPYAECVELAVRVARYYDHIWAWGHPIVTCEVRENGS